MLADNPSSRGHRVCPAQGRAYTEAGNNRCTRLVMAGIKSGDHEWVNLTNVTRADQPEPAFVALESEFGSFTLSSRASDA